MSSSPKFSTHGAWKIVYSGQDETEDRVADGRKTLAHTLSIPKSMCILSDTKTEILTVTELDPPMLKLPQLSSDTIEKVFPVRSILSFDSTPSSALQTPSLDKLESPISPFSDVPRASGLLDEKPNTQHSQPPSEPDDRTGLKRPDYLSQLREQKQELGEWSSSSLTLPIRSDRCSSNASLSYSDAARPRIDSHSERTHDTRLKKLIHEGGSVLASKIISQGIQFSRNDDDCGLEIQKFGAVLVIFELEGNYTVQVASSNSKDVVGISTDELFGLPSICDILAPTHQQAFVSHAEVVLEDEYDVEVSGPEIFSLFIPESGKQGRRFWCTMHTSKIYKDYIICELEPEVSDGQSLDGNQLGEKPSFRTHKPVSVKEPWFQRTPSGQCESDSPDADSTSAELNILNTLTPIIQQISGSQTMNALTEHIVSGLQRLIGLHRVTMYHFDSACNGIVVVDSVDKFFGLDSFEGTTFDEGTFTADVKAQYLRNTVCFSYSHGGELAQLVYRSLTSKLGLDLSHCYLTAAPKGMSDAESPSVSACMSIGIYVFGKLWGFICCQSYDEKFRLQPPLQRALWLMGETISSNIERLSYTLPFQPRDANPLQPKLYPRIQNESSSDLLVLFGADYAAASILGETKMLGKPPDSQEVLVLHEYLRAKSLDSVLWSTDILSDFDDLEYSPGFHHLAGLLYIPLSADGHDFIIFFRNENARRSDGLTMENRKLEPGSRQAEWSAAEFGKASMLAMMYRTFTDIWQEKEAAMQNNQLLKLLLANSAHEFRTPLNAIINYLEIALDGNLNQETRENISRSHSASKSLVYIINDLLDLTNAETGLKLIKDEVFSLSEALCEATDIFWEEARQKKVDLQVVQHSALPPVLGDQRRVRQVITNLISNAVQHTSVGAVTIESCILSESREPGYIAIEVAIHDTGSGMPQETVEALFCELEQVSNKGDMQDSKSPGKSSGTAALEKDSVLGLGLALVARIVRNMNGQLSLKSKEDCGSCFKIRLKFPLPEEEEEEEGVSQAPDWKVDERQGEPLYCEREQPTKERYKEIAKSKDPLSYHCGDEVSNTEELGQKNGALVDVDVALKSGESRSIALSSSEQPAIESTTGPDPASKADSKTGKLNILVAEDDPINSTILRKRLEKFGYSVRMTGNGKECASVFRESPRTFDAVLMDLQVSVICCYTSFCDCQLIEE